MPVVDLYQWEMPYRALRRHLNTMPVGFPATLSGVERCLLKAVFTVDEARLALHMDYRFESADMITVRDHLQDRRHPAGEKKFSNRAAQDHRGPDGGHYGREKGDGGQAAGCRQRGRGHKKG